MRLSQASHDRFRRYQREILDRLRAEWAIQRPHPSAVRLQQQAKARQTVSDLEPLLGPRWAPLFEKARKVQR